MRLASAVGITSRDIQPMRRTVTFPWILSDARLQQAKSVCRRGLGDWENIAITPTTQSLVSRDIDSETYRHQNCQLTAAAFLFLGTPFWWQSRHLVVWMLCLLALSLKVVSIFSTGMPQFDI